MVQEPGRCGKATYCRDQILVPPCNRLVPLDRTKCAWRFSISKRSNWLQLPLYSSSYAGRLIAYSTTSSTHTTVHTSTCLLLLQYLCSQRGVHGDGFNKPRRHGGSKAPRSPLHHRREEPAGGALASTRRQVLAQVHINSKLYYLLSSV